MYTDIQEEFRTKERPNRRDPEVLERIRQNKISSRAKFNTISEMKQHHAAIQVLHKNGYSPDAMKEISRQFLDSTEYAMREIERMKENVEAITKNPY